MTIYLYSLPAALAFFVKALLLGYWRRSPIRDARTRLFVFAVVISMSMNVIEFTGLQGYWGNDVVYAGYMYNSLLIGLFAVLVHLTILVAYDEPPALLRRWLVPLMYGYVLCIVVLLAGSRLVIAGFELLGSYTITRIPGPLYPLFEAFGISTLLMILVFPIRGVRQNADGQLRSRCQIWMLAAMPASLIVITVLILLRLNIRWFNATVTLPIPMAMLLVAIGYCVHNRRIIDPFAYLPFTNIRKRKRALHASLTDITSDIPATHLDALLDRLASAIACPVSLADSAGIVAMSRGANATFPGNWLHQVQETLVRRETGGTVKEALNTQRVGAIVPLFSTSETARGWLIFGDAFEAHFYTPADFQVLDRVVKRLAGLLLDRRAQPAPRSAASPTHERHNLAGIGPNAQQLVAGRMAEPATGSLPERLAAYEAFLIGEALRSCSGNKAKAARLLGLRPNTLHYKLRRLKLP